MRNWNTKKRPVNNNISFNTGNLLETLNDHYYNDAMQLLMSYLPH